MSNTFQNAPLVEIIAELRWTPQSFPMPTGSGGEPVPVFPPQSASLEEFFMRFGGEVYQHGFQRTERLVPPGFPSMLYQPIYRHQRGGADSAASSVMFQTGPGILAINATPPYKSWDNFLPTVQQGIRALLNARPADEKEQKFSSVSLRYIDAFKQNLTGDLNQVDFVSEILGIRLDLPASIKKHGSPDETPKSLIQLAQKLSNGMNMRMQVGEAQVNAETSILMDTTITDERGIEPSEERLMSALDSAHSILNEMFLDLTKPIHDRMKPNN